MLCAAFIDTLTVGLGKRMMLRIVQEFIRGRTLEHERTERRFDERMALAVLREVLTTLMYPDPARRPSLCPPGPASRNSLRLHAFWHHMGIKTHGDR